jgi:hypothetical protein
MRDVFTAVVALLVLALGASVILMHRRVGRLSTQMRESNERRTAEQLEAAAEVRRILAVDEDPPANGDRKRRRHLRALPVFAGLAVTIGTLIRWAKDNPLQAAASTAVSTATAAAVLSVPSGRTDHALPEPPPPPAVEAPGPIEAPPQTPASPTVPDAPRRPTQVPRVIAPPIAQPDAPTAPVDPPSDHEPTIPPSEPPAPPGVDPPAPTPPDETPVASCLLRVDLLIVRLKVCTSESA